MKQSILIIDFGSQYTQLITRKIREQGYYSEIVTVEQAKEILSNETPSAIVLSGGPNSIFEDENDYSFLFDKCPLLGICYGMQLITHHFGGKVTRGIKGEYGKATVTHKGEEKTVWMSHFDHVEKVPEGFEVVYETKDFCAGMESKEKSILALQFHPEVEHSEIGDDVLNYFLKDIAKIEPTWTTDNMVTEALTHMSEATGRVICGFSGGVDSLVAAILSHKAGNELHCFFINNGLIRPQDLLHIEKLQKVCPFEIQVVDESDLFISRLEGVSEPEKKRKIIGNTFIEVFEKQVRHLEKEHGKFKYLLQGTLYPDVIESISPHKKDGKSVTIKSHHNVGGLPDDMELELLEPLRFLFKDEVRKIGKELGIPESATMRHPFPGPGLGIRILGAITKEKVLMSQQADQILFEELNNFDLYDKTWQAFMVFLPVKTVGIKGDERAYEEVMCMRLVDSSDGMTAKWTYMPYEFIDKVSSRVTNEVSGITRVVYDVTAKPPGTIEWE